MTESEAENMSLEEKEKHLEHLLAQVPSKIEETIGMGVITALLLSMKRDAGVEKMYENKFHMKQTMEALKKSIPKVEECLVDLDKQIAKAQKVA